MNSIGIKNARFYGYRLIWKLLKCTPILFVADIFSVNCYQSRDTSTLISRTVAAVIVLSTFRIILFMITFIAKHNLDSLRHQMNEHKSAKSEVVSMANALFPETTRLLSGSNFDILCIGTNHMSALSALQSAEMVRILRPDELVLELDSQRAMNLFHISGDHSGPNLAEDIMDWKQYIHPIPLVIRIFTKMMNFIHSAGSEFVESAQAAWSLDNDCSVIFGDQDIVDTFNEVNSTTPIWISLAVNAVLFGFVYYPIASNSLHFIGDIVHSLIHYGLTLVLGKLFVVSLLCGVFHLFLSLWVQLLVEFSKGMYSNQTKMKSEKHPNNPTRSRFVKSIGKKAMRNPRDVVLARNTMNTVKEFSGEYKLVIAVVGIGHMENVIDFAAEMLTEVANWY